LHVHKKEGSPMNIHLLLGGIFAMFALIYGGAMLIRKKN
jgi:hypothetical protein